MTALGSELFVGKALIAAGGTGGHVYPALAVASVLTQQGWTVNWLGTERGIEQRLVPSAGLPLHHLTVSGLRGKSFIARCQAVLRLLIAVWQSLRVVRDIQPDVVLGMGGYASGPAGVAAWLSRRPLVIHEQNAVAGTTNRWLAPLATRVLCGLPGGLERIEKATVVGNPVRAGLLDAQGQEASLPPDQFSEERPLRVLVLGGSLGAAPLNALIPATIDRLLERGFGARIALWQQCGERNRAEADIAWQGTQFQDLRLDDFIDDMAAAYGWADLVIARAGALTISELAATGRASVLIPLPHAIDDHQTRNARVLANAGAAVLMPQAEATPEALAERISDWLEQPLSLTNMARAARGSAQPDATQRVVSVLQEVAHASV